MDEAGPSPTGERSFAGLAIEVLESIADGFLAVESDWRVVYFNLRASELLRVEKSEWRDQLPQLHEHYARFEALPQELHAQLRALEQRLT